MKAINILGIAALLLLVSIEQPAQALQLSNNEIKQRLDKKTRK